MRQPDTTRTRSSRSRRPRCALTLVEVVVSTLIVSVMTVVALDALGTATQSSMSAGNRALALGLADELMAEILATPYDDLMTYQNWSESLAGDRAGWVRRATVHRALVANPQQNTAGVTESGARRIRVTVELDGQKFAEQIALRTNTD